MNQVRSNKEAEEILAPGRQIAEARVRDQQANPSNQIQTITLDLTTARTEADPYKFPVPFKSMYIQSATDSQTSIDFKANLGKRAGESKITLARKDVLNFEYKIAGGSFSHSAQSGKSITIVFLLEADFKSGTQITENSGGVAIEEGTSIDATTRVTLAATTATIIAPANADRNVTYIENATAGPLYISGSNTVTNSGATRGLVVQSGDWYEHRNTAALYGYSVAGGDIHYMEQE